MGWYTKHVGKGMLFQVEQVAKLEGIKGITCGHGTCTLIMSESRKEITRALVTETGQHVFEIQYN